MNKKQRNILIIGIILISAVLIVWYSQGFEVFTKTQVLIDKTTDLDRMLGVENKKFVDKFVFGLLPSGFSSFLEVTSVATFLAIIIFISGILIYLFRNKKKETV
jgi:hypothetical protein